MEDKKLRVKKLMTVLTVRREASKLTILMPIIIYALLYVLTIKMSTSEAVITFKGNTMPVTAYAGVLSSISNICLVIMVLFYKRTGFIISMAILILQLPFFFARIVIRQNLSSMPGLFLSIFTTLMLVIIYNNHLKMAKEKERQRNLFVQTATALVNAIDAKDVYTHGHSSRVAEYARKLAEMNFKSESECDEIYYAALLHDVGKIGVSEDIIKKKGKLTAEEYNEIKQHSVIGAQILQSISEFPFLSIGARSHHERYDGKGYPYGLKGTDIPELARIISVADAYDAMSSMRSYRDPLPQQIVREELVKGIGTQFDPTYARLMLHMLDVDTEYEMREREEGMELAGKNELIVEKHRSEVSEGILLTPFMTTIRMTVDSADLIAVKPPTPSLVVFDSLDSRVHVIEKEITSLNYFEYGEVWFDGRTSVSGARKMQTNVIHSGSADVTKRGEYKLEAVKIRDHALIRIISEKQTVEVIIALPDGTRYVYLGLTGEHCRIRGVSMDKAEEQSPQDYIPRIAEEISYVKDLPVGDVPNVQVDGYRTAASEGVEITDGLTISFHAKNLPTARLVWHCPFIDVFCADDGLVNGANYRDLAFMRFDGEFWECDPNCSAELNANRNEKFEGWDEWKKQNRDGYDAIVTFKREGGRITIITENAGISIKNTAILTGIDRKVYAAVTGDQVAITNIRFGGVKDGKVSGNID